MIGAMNIETGLLIMLSVVTLGVIGIMIAAAIRKDHELIRAIGARTLILCILSLAVAIVVVDSLFGWLGRSIPDTEWWDGALTMGVLIALVAIATSAIHIVQTAVGAWTSDAPPSAPDHLGQAIEGLRESNRSLIRAIGSVVEPPPNEPTNS